MTRGMRAAVDAVIDSHEAEIKAGQPVEFRYRGKGYRLVPCPGNAHSPEVAGNQDHCALCAPLWGTAIEFLP